MDIFGKRSVHVRGEKRGFVYAWTENYLQPNSKAKLSWTTLRMSRPLFVGSFCRSCGGLSANEKEEQFASSDNLGCKWLS